MMPGLVREARIPTCRGWASSLSLTLDQHLVQIWAELLSLWGLKNWEPNIPSSRPSPGLTLGST